MYSVPVVVAITALSTIVLIMAVERALRTRAMDRESEQNRHRRQQHVALLEELNSLKKELARKRDIADQLPVIAKNLTEKLSADCIPAIAVRAFKEFFHATQVGYFVAVPNSPDYTLEVGVGFSPDWQERVRVHSDEGILGVTLQKRTVVSRTELRASSGRRPSGRSLEQLGVSPDFAAPVFGVAELAGVIVVSGSPFPPDEERRYVSMLADLISIAIQKANLSDAHKTAAWKDDLTGVAKRLHFLQRFEAEIRRTENYQQPFALFMFDVDRFKAVNDTYGHAAGDVVIRKVAEIAMLNTRSSDLVGRYGGDEFLVLITSSTQEQAFQYCENIRKKFAATEIRIPGLAEPIRLTISGGLAVFPAHGHSTAELTRAADHALYEAKRRGRDQTVIASVDTVDRLFPGEEAPRAMSPRSEAWTDPGQGDETGTAEPLPDPSNR
jgi:diguanylate cyclase (GGDEF)-like protein